ncbi:helix-turn-helix domain protein [Candidatus Methanoplasma termitum]|uniref:Helix-turn-helix domain protein n=1 Tax=Candidatus Methanoplasma termitum TaxID=1577791 RepID=A0A0A7LFP1_9ARCH|nr:helix-turn-helix domain-containing protein [Candidatus Methanoplasma termitum]AIZ57077.1 helix-turn-helix domain protein [Candidatus Methanoplasma termitum]
MNDLDTILSVIENPTRRRILMALVREPHYPLQLSKELGVSQQAIMKNLDILEKNGLVESRKESSDRGPVKMVYRPTSEFTLTIDMRNGLFRATLSMPASVDDAQENRDMEFDEVRETLSEIDRQISEFDRLREEMIERRNRMMSSFMHGPIASELGYLERSIIYGMLNSPEHDASEVSREMGLRDDTTTKVVNDIENKCKDPKRVMRNE